jgi:hypothetical protein
MTDFEAGVCGSIVIWGIALLMMAIIASRMPKNLE